MENLLKVFYRPGEVFASMKEKIEVGPPLLVLLLCIVVFTAARPLFISDEGYTKFASETAAGLLEWFSGVGDEIIGEEDMQELQQALVEETGYTSIDEFVDEAAETIPPNMYRIERITGAIGAPFGALIWLGMGTLTLALYFHITGITNEIRRPWSQWFGFTMWSMLPVALYYFVLFLATMFTGEFMPKSYLSPLAWIPGLHNNAFAINLTFGMILIIWIQSVGMQHWHDRPLPICVTIVLIPWLLQWFIASGVVEGMKAIGS